jgi:hypothetical protein
MKATGKNISLAIALSFALHAAVFAGIAGTGSFLWFDITADNPINVTITTQKPYTAKTKPSPSYIEASKELNHADAPKTMPVESPTDIENAEEIISSKETAIITDMPAESVKNISDSDRAPKQTATTEKTELMKNSHEKFIYKIYWSGFYAGDATIEASREKGIIKISSNVRSAPFISIFYKVENHAESSLLNNMPSVFIMKQREGKFRRYKEIIFDASGKNIAYIDHLKGTTENHPVAAEMPWDIMSALYYLRSLNIAIGGKINIPIFDNNKFYEAEVEVIKKDKITTIDYKEIDSVVVKLRLKSDGLFRNKGEIAVWVSDDPYKIPIKVEAEVPIGKVSVDLIAMEINN